MTTSTSFKLCGLFVLAALLRLVFLGSGSLQVDEAMSLYGAAGAPDVHPPLFYWILRVWGGHFSAIDRAWLAYLWDGHSEAYWRFPQVLASLLSLWLCWRLWGRLDVVLVLACSFMELQQAREVRMYAWLHLWVVAHMVCVHEERRVGAAVTMLAACFTHLFGLFLIFTGRSRWWVVCLWLFWGVPHYWVELASHPLSLRSLPSVLEGVEAVGRLVGGRVCPFGDLISVVLGVLVLGLLAWRRPSCARWVWGWAFLPWVSLFLVSYFGIVSLFEFKYLVWTLPAWVFLLVSCGRWVVLPLVVLNLWGSLPWLVYPHRWMADWRGVAGLLRFWKGPSVHVHPSMMAAPLLYYYGGMDTMRPVDEWAQVRKGSALLWVCTPHHPFVRAQALEVGLLRFWQLRDGREFACLLPSGVVRVGWWEWKGAPSEGEKQRGR